MTETGEPLREEIALETSLEIDNRRSSRRAVAEGSRYKVSRLGDSF